MGERGEETDTEVSGCMEPPHLCIFYCTYTFYCVFLYLYGTRAGTSVAVCVVVCVFVCACFLMGGGSTLKTPNPHVLLTHFVYVSSSCGAGGHTTFSCFFMLLFVFVCLLVAGCVCVCFLLFALTHSPFVVYFLG